MMAGTSKAAQYSLLELVVDALRVVALPADHQVAVLPEFVHAPDEVALTYRDAWLLVPELREADLVSDDELELFSELDRLFDQMSEADDRETLWTTAAMQQDERWERTRELALRALAELGYAPAPATVRGTSWVDAR